MPYPITLNQMIVLMVALIQMIDNPDCQINGIHSQSCTQTEKIMNSNSFYTDRMKFMISTIFNLSPEIELPKLVLRYLDNYLFGSKTCSHDVHSIECIKHIACSKCINSLTLLLDPNFQKVLRPFFRCLGGINYLYVLELVVALYNALAQNQPLFLIICTFILKCGGTLLYVTAHDYLNNVADPINKNLYFNSRFMWVVGLIEKSTDLAIHTVLASVFKLLSIKYNPVKLTTYDIQILKSVSPWCLTVDCGSNVWRLTQNSNEVITDDVHRHIVNTPSIISINPSISTSLARSDYRNNFVRLQLNNTSGLFDHTCKSLQLIEYHMENGWTYDFENLPQYIHVDIMNVPNLIHTLIKKYLIPDIAAIVGQYLGRIDSSLRSLSSPLCLGGSVDLHSRFPPRSYTTKSVFFYKL